MIMYKLIKLPNGSLANSVENLDNNTFIPFDQANTDAQQFAKCLKEGNVPEPAVEGEQVTQEWIDQTIALLLPNG
jgi:hypothetical protein